MKGSGEEKVGTPPSKPCGFGRFTNTLPQGLRGDHIPLVYAAPSVEILVVLVEGRDRYVDDPEFADRAVADSRRDVDRGHGPDGDEFSVEFEMSLTFEDEVDLGHDLVVVGLGILLDVNDMKRGHAALVGEGLQ